METGSDAEAEKEYFRKETLAASRRRAGKEPDAPANYNATWLKYGSRSADLDQEDGSNCGRG
jgi:hypothetical protein